MADDWDAQEAPAEKGIENEIAWADEDQEDPEEQVADAWDAESGDEEEKKKSSEAQKAEAEKKKKPAPLSKLSRKKAAEIAAEQKKIAEQKAAAEASDVALQRKKKEEIEAMARERDLLLSGDLLGVDRDTVKAAAEEKLKNEEKEKREKKLAKEAAALLNDPNTQSIQQNNSNANNNNNNSNNNGTISAPFGSTIIENFPLNDDNQYDRLAEIVGKRLNLEGNSGLASQRLVRFLKALTNKIGDNMRIDEFAELKRFSTSIHNEKTEKLKNKKKGPVAKQTQLKTVNVGQSKVDRNNIGFENNSNFDDNDDFM